MLLYPILDVVQIDQVLQLYRTVQMSLKDFQIISQLGEGAYSTVFRVKRLIDSQEYAMKKVKMDNLSEKEKQNSLNEVRVLASINHPNIIAYKEAFLEKGSNFLYIIMEYANDGDLLGKIRDHSKKQTLFSEKQIWSIFIQVTQGLKMLHDLKILHRDIKSANVFLNKDGTVKLGDLNVSKMAKSLCQTQTGTPYYASPEIWKDQAYDKKSDVWSLGCVLYEMIALKPPFRASDMQGLYKKIIRGFYSRLPPEYSSDLNIILKMLLQVAPHLRATCDKILEHPIVMKHLVDLPEEYLSNPVGTGELLKTIVIDRRENTDDLAKKVELPKSRYFNTIDVRIPNLNRASVMEKGSSFLPRINSKNYDLPDSSKSIEYERGERHKKADKKIESEQSILLSEKLYSIQDRRDRKVESHNPVDSNKKQMLRMYEGRIKQLSPDIIEMILRKEKEKQRVQSIIGTK